MQIIKNTAFINIILYIVLGAVLMVLGNGISFLLGSVCYSLLVVWVSSWVEKGSRRTFFNLVTFFLLFYSVYVVITHYVFIDNPFNDFYVNIDSTQYIANAIRLSKLSYSGIWQVAFSRLEYSSSSLFYAWMGTLQKIIHLNAFYSLLFQKLNVAFFGSFIPGIVYLMCKRVTDKKNTSKAGLVGRLFDKKKSISYLLYDRKIGNKQAFKAAIVYGLLSFTFTYSVGLMRDIHVALIYAIGLYIITGDKYNLKIILLLFY